MQASRANKKSTSERIKPAKDSLHFKTEHRNICNTTLGCIAEGKLKAIKENGKKHFNFWRKMEKGW